MSQMMQIDAQYVAKKLQEWSEKSNKPVLELKQTFQDFLAKTDGRTDAVKYRKALNALKRTFETSMNSSAVAYQVIILGMTSPYDVVKKRRAELEEKYLKSPSECIASGEVRLTGNDYELIDIHKTFPSGSENFNYGKPIPKHSWMATMYGVAKKPEEDQKWLPAIFALRDELATGKIPFFTQMSVRFNGKYSSEQNRYLLNSSKGSTNFDSIGKEVSIEEIANIVDTVYNGKFVTPNNLRQDLEATKGDRNRFVVTEATLNRHYKNDSGTSSIELIDETLDLGDKITGFVDPNISSMLDNLRDGEAVSVIGRTSLSDERDPHTKEKTGEQVLTMNVFSVFPRPE